MPLPRHRRRHRGRRRAARSPTSSSTTARRTSAPSSAPRSPRALAEHDGVLALGGGAVLDAGDPRSCWPGQPVVFLRRRPRRRGQAGRASTAPGRCCSATRARRGCGCSTSARPLYERGRDRHASTPTGARPSEVAAEVARRCRAERGERRRCADARPSSRVGDAVRRRRRARLLDRRRRPARRRRRAQVARRAPADAGRAGARRVRRRACAAAGLDVLAPRCPTARRPRPPRSRPGCWEALGQAGFTRSDAVVGVGGGATTDLAGLRRRDLAARGARGARADHPARHGRRGGRRQDRHQHRRGQEPRRRLPPAGRRALRPRRCSRRCRARSSSAGLAEVVKCGLHRRPGDPRPGRGRPGAAADPRDGPHTARAGRAGRSGSRPTSSPPTSRESGLREILNYGHTLAHAIEQVERYRWRHGEAVAVGMVFAAELARLAGRLDADVVARHRDVLAVGRAADDVPGRPVRRAARPRCAVDKKSRGDLLRFVVLDGLGAPGAARGPGRGVAARGVRRPRRRLRPPRAHRKGTAGPWPSRPPRRAGLVRHDDLPAAQPARPEPPVHPDHDRGLEFDVRTLVARRSALGLISGAGLAGARRVRRRVRRRVGLVLRDDRLEHRLGERHRDGSGDPASAVVDTEVPDETGGPYPGDGTQRRGRPRRLRHRARSDIRSSIGTSTTTAAGVPLTVNLTVLDARQRVRAPWRASPSTLWHCERAGPVLDVLAGRGGRELPARRAADRRAAGTATFTTVFPGCYPGRWPHIHFEVYRSTAEATSAGQIVKTSQIALPQAACEAVYADAADVPGQRGQPVGHLADPGHGLRRRRRHPPARDGDRRRDQRLRREPHHRGLRPRTAPARPAARTGAPAQSR